MKRFLKGVIDRALNAAGYELRRAEWRSSATANLYDIRSCFRLLFDREPTIDEFNYYKVLVNAGMPLQHFVALFLDNAEHRNIQARRQAAKSSLKLLQLPHFKLWISEGDFLIGRGIEASGNYEPHVSAMIRNLLRSGMTFVDVGANIGYHTLVAASIVGETGKVYSFEPSLFNCNLLLRSAKTNGFSNIELFPVALANTERIMIYDDVGGSNGTVSEFNFDLPSIFGRTLTRSTTLDRALSGASVDLIKIDVEGAEYFVVQGGAGLLARERPFIISEFSRQLETVSQVSGEQYLQFLIDAGYSLSILHRAGEIEDCGKRPAAVMARLEMSGGLMDLLATPAD